MYPTYKNIYKEWPSIKSNGIASLARPSTKSVLLINTDHIENILCMHSAEITIIYSNRKIKFPPAKLWLSSKFIKHWK